MLAWSTLHRARLVQRLTSRSRSSSRSSMYGYYAGITELGEDWAD